MLQPGPGVFCALAELSQPHVIPLTYRVFINSCPISFLRLFEPIGQGLWDTLVQSADQPDININFSLNVRIVCTYIEFTTKLHMCQSWIYLQSITTRHTAANRGERKKEKENINKCREILFPQALSLETYFPNCLTIKLRLTKNTMYTSEGYLS